jgi:hypothetical protein
MNAEFVNAQARAHAVARAFGDSAPPPLVGESLHDYRARLASPYLKHSKALQGANLAKIHDPNAFNAIEDQVYTDAAREAMHPTSFRPGELRAIATPDASGRVITRYVGDPNACWDQFNPGIRYIRRLCVPGR